MYTSKWVEWYTAQKKRGIKRSYLPTPRHLEFPTQATYEDLLACGREVFFAGLPEAEAVYYLAESSGVAVPNLNPGMLLCQYFWALVRHESMSCSTQMCR